jgi:hypothetical protein
VEYRYDEAEKLAKQALSIQRRVLGPENPATVLTTYNVACIAHRGHTDAALSLLREAVDHGLPPFADLFVDKDNDFKSMLGNARFDALVVHAKERHRSQETKQLAAGACPSPFSAYK